MESPNQKQRAETTSEGLSPVQLFNLGADSAARKTHYAYNLIDGEFVTKNEQVGFAWLEKSQRALRAEYDADGFASTPPVEPKPNVALTFVARNVTASCSLIPRLGTDAAPRESLEIYIEVLQHVRKGNAVKSALDHKLGTMYLPLEEFCAAVNPASPNSEIQSVLDTLLKSERQDRLAYEKRTAPRPATARATP